MSTEIENQITSNKMKKDSNKDDDDLFTTLIGSCSNRKKITVEFFKNIRMKNKMLKYTDNKYIVILRFDIEEIKKIVDVLEYLRTGETDTNLSDESFVEEYTYEIEKILKFYLTEILGVDWSIYTVNNEIKGELQYDVKDGESTEVLVNYVNLLIS